ncbi:UNVERIFIED_CONTAM: hypothetical protein Slati_3929400 [Sesamum latifolium]|uniref:Uncharacterized protein n=1 Tax=Sesamum latifolium TaxID=2727402 RepID=A0AAW2TP21_9LAMI
MLTWQQRSKSHWLVNGDGNTKFFHSQASSRRRQNSIHKLRDECGYGGMRRRIFRLFSCDILFLPIFRCCDGCSAACCGTTGHSKMNAHLAEPFTTDEVKRLPLLVGARYPSKKTN